MTPAEIIQEIIYAYRETLSDDADDLAHADFAGFCRWAWPNDEPLRSFNVAADAYRDCLHDAYHLIHKAHA